MKNILVAIDFSNATDTVLEQIGRLACPNSSVIHLVHVVEPNICYEVSGVMPDEIPMSATTPEEENTIIAIAKNHLNKAAEKLKAITGAEVTQNVIDEFEISDAVLNFAKTHDIDMIVVGKHNHGFLSSVLLGSVTQSIVRLSPVPVLVVPAPDKK